MPINEYKYTIKVNGEDKHAGNELLGTLREICINDLTEELTIEIRNNCGNSFGKISIDLETMNLTVINKVITLKEIAQWKF